MGEIVEERSSDTAVPWELEEPKVAVAVGKGDSGAYALKWTLESLVSMGGVVYLLHVQAPLRLIPTPMGNSLPVEQVSEDIVNRFKQQRFSETEKLLFRYQQMCRKERVEPKVCYIESELIQKALVEQISKMGISKLVLGTSSSSRLVKAIKGGGISTYVAKNAPEFCSVMVVNKGKIVSVKDANKLLSPDYMSDRSTSSTSDHSPSISSMVEGEALSENAVKWQISKISSVKDSFPLPTMQNEQATSTSFPELNTNPIDESVFVHISNDSKGKRLVSLNQTSNTSESLGRFGFHIPVAEIARRKELRTRSAGYHIVSSPSTATGQLRRSETLQPTGTSGYPFNSEQDHEALADRMSPAIYSAGFMDSPSIYDNCGLLESRSVDMDVLENDGISVTSMETLVMETPIIEVHRQSSSDLSDRSSQQANSLSSSTTHEIEITTDVEMLKHEIETLKYQLEKTNMAAEKAQRESDLQTVRCKKAEEVITIVMRMAETSDAQKREEARMRTEALRDAEIARQLAAAETRGHEEALLALEELKKVAEAAMRDVEIVRQQAAEEKKNHEEALAALEVAMRDADIARHQATAETRRCMEALTELEEAKKALEVEIQLRRDAEERARHEAISKQEAIAALRRAQKRYVEYNFKDLCEATNNFAEQQKLGEGGYGSVYKGVICHTTVAIKVLRQDGMQGQQEFQREVEVLSHIHHPHMVMLLGACPERGCIVYEHMANGSLEDRLTCKGGTPPLPWYTRFRISSEVAIALLFLHRTHPDPIVHRDLKPGNILLDHNFVSKISDVGLAKLVPHDMSFSVTMYRDTVPAGTLAYMDPDYQRTGTVGCHSDVYALGIIMLQLLTGKPPVGVMDLVEAAVDNGRLHEVLDWSAGEWPLPEAMEFACLGLQCAEPRRKHRPDLETRVLSTLENIRIVAEVAAANEANERLSPSSGEPIIPSFFICPISQEVMQNPHIAADGFTYEYEAIKTWLDGHNTSPMTNLRLNHKNLIPNHSLRSAICEWQTNRGARET